MNHCVIQQKHDACEEMRSSVAVVVADPVSESRDPVVCPKPRRITHLNSAFDNPDSRAGNELLDIILSKDCGSGTEQPNTAHVASSPPFFSGSPPSRIANPLIQDARFREEKIASLQHFCVAPNPDQSYSPSTTLSSAGKKGGCVSVRSNFGSNPSIRVVGFECMDRDRRNPSVPAFA